jgi:hypothetical protein
MARTLSVVFLLAWCCSVHAIGWKLTKNVYQEDVLEGKPAWLVYFYSKDCAECAGFDKHWATIAAKVSKLRLGRVDLDRWVWTQRF